MRINSSAVIGASGKMGRGIAACLAWKMMLDSWRLGKDLGALYLHDIDREKLIETRRFLMENLRRKAEREIVSLRSLTRDNKRLIDNSQIIDYFDGCLMKLLCLTQSLSELKQVAWVFEAISEDLSLKQKVLADLDEVCDDETKFLTNTSSFPIHLLTVSLSDKRFLASFHFYNPPEKQMLVECVVAQRKDLPILQDLANSLNKKLVLADDVPGFIGNGFFVRESLWLIDQCDGSANDLYCWDQVFSRACLRPMACFELIDYVGVDVFHKIASFMEQELEGFYSLPSYLKTLLNQGLRGGYTSVFSRLDGFYKYEDNKKVAMYDFLKNVYVPLSQLGYKDFGLGNDWKSVKKNSALLELHFQKFEGTEFQEKVGLILKHEVNLGEALVDSGVCMNEADLDRVLMWGFGHLYGVGECRKILDAWGTKLDRSLSGKLS
jgi:3-hydroxybutyryl-CoA dehydrogenase